MFKWMAQTLHPELFDYNMIDEITQYYEQFYDYTLTEEQAQGILDAQPEAAKGISLSEAVRREADHPQNRIIRMRHKKTGTVISAKAEPGSARLKRNEPVFLYVRRRFI